MSRRKFNFAALAVCLAAFSSLCLFPVLWILLTAIRPHGEIFERTLHLLPSAFAWRNIVAAWRLYPVAYWLLNSLVITILGGGLTLLVDLLAGYAFAKFTFKGRDTLFWIFLGSLMLPAQVLMVPQFMTIAAFHGVNTYAAAFLPRAAETYGVFLARQFLREVPDELLDAARLDGASEWQVFCKVVLPLSKPAIAVLALLLSLGEWNDFGWPMVILRSEKAMTLPVGLSLLQGYRVNDWTGIMVITTVAIIPVTLLFVSLQRYFVQGVSRSGLK